MLIGLEGSSPLTDDQYRQTHGAESVSLDKGVTGGPKFRLFKGLELKDMPDVGGTTSILTLENFKTAASLMDYFQCLHSAGKIYN